MTVTSASYQRVLSSALPFPSSVTPDDASMSPERLPKYLTPSAHSFRLWEVLSVEASSMSVSIGSGRYGICPPSLMGRITRRTAAASQPSGVRAFLRSPGAKERRE